HVIDLINFFAGARPEWVSAELEPGFERYLTGYHGDGGHDPASEPGANAQIGYENGVRGTYLGMKGTLLDIGVSVIGTEGRIEINWAAERMVVKTPAGLAERALQLSGVGLRREYQTTAIAGAVADLIRAIETDQPTLSPPEEARHAVAVMLGMIRSHFADGRRIALPGTGEDFAPAGVDVSGGE
ncbi:MAG TPA: hypothetical protein VFK80_04875, partial [Limnochordia bacterium]|nr:hypothetical protein [Limnochordia bacterium]